MPENYYEILSVSYDAPTEDIITAWNLAKSSEKLREIKRNIRNENKIQEGETSEDHIARLGKLYGEKISRIDTAYSVLSDPRRRQECK